MYSPLFIQHLLGVYLSLQGPREGADIKRYTDKSGIIALAQEVDSTVTGKGVKTYL